MGIYSDIQFALFKSIVVLKPRGYLYSIDPSSQECTIGIQAIPDSLNQYRLGSVFLRNFYVGLDYANNKLLIGLNKNTNDADIVGNSPNPFNNKPKSNSTAVFLVFFFLGLTILGGLCYYRHKRNENERRVVFDNPGPLLSDDGQPVRRYKDGVEIKPSEYLKLKEEEKKEEKKI